MRESKLKSRLVKIMIFFMVLWAAGQVLLTCYRMVKSMVMLRLVALPVETQNIILLILMVLYLAPGSGFIGVMNRLVVCTFV